jgi:hypothetical protein
MGSNDKTNEFTFKFYNNFELEAILDKVNQLSKPNHRAASYTILPSPGSHSAE